ncbi:DUF1285 domain-containing protein [Sphingomonas turrisvirgatae]|uniref:Proteophosphoglycan n=1 Tax=Sphingomonas turrisvirgatae TaxID=1888892 RepID=A0A1E3LTI8_9SPHN|nr:DUF1285 domain-containing protein [Sphingomonas turrisvirgatae]ODP37057.1 hypothetical protein BFL28_19045 [Sphingomonas turrisvirgatae]
MPMTPPPELASLSLAEIARLAEAQKLPPVASWNPAHCGHSDMRIARDGTWYHQGSPIGRPAMVRLFSTILRREPDGRHVLVTPVEKLDIDVEDAPFVAVEMKVEGEGRQAHIAFRLNTGDLVPAGPDHPIRFDQHDDGPHPYLAVLNGLEALIARSVYYDLVALALDNGSDPAGIWSRGAFFPIAPA